MDLKTRLGLLRGQSSSPARQEAGVAERVARYRCTTAQRNRADAERIAQVIDGQQVASDLILVERRIPLHAQHGRVRLSRLAAKPECLPGLHDADPSRLVFLDTETTGLSGGAGTIVFLLGLARLDDDVLVVRQYMLTAFAGEQALLGAAADWLDGSAVLVTFNGKTFDLPLLTSRCRMARVIDRFGGLAHHDLLHPTRRAFAQKWNDCRLATAEQNLLHFVRSDDLPGSEAPQAWLSLIRSGQVNRLPGLLRHNYWDLLSLAALVPALDEAHAAPGSCNADVLGVARGLFKQGYDRRAFAILEDNRSRLSAAGLLELARAYRRQRLWRQACDVWEALAESGCTEAIEQLAKYHEHVVRNFSAALGYTARLPQGNETERRSKRLKQRIGSPGPWGW